MTVIEEENVPPEEDTKVVRKSHGQLLPNTSRAMRHKDEHKELMLAKSGQSQLLTAKHVHQQAALQQAKLRLFFRQLCYPKVETFNVYPAEKQYMIPYAMQYCGYQQNY